MSQRNKLLHHTTRLMLIGLDYEIESPQRSHCFMCEI